MLKQNNALRNSILLAIVLLKFFIQFSLTHPAFELHRDEFLHLDQANHLAWGYLSVPPVTSWISYLVKLLGNSIFWIKFFPALFGALTIVVVWKSVEALKGNLFSMILAAGCVTFSVLFRLNLLYQPNSLDVLCWAAIYYFVIRYLNSYNNKWLYLLAVSFAIGFLNKYNIVFLLMGLIPAAVLTPERKIFLNKHLYSAMALSLLMILPNLYWQYENNFPVIGHMQELAATQLVNVNRWNFIRSQFLFFPGTFLVILFALFALITYAPFKKFRSFFWVFFINLCVFLLLKAKDYYAIGLYPVYFAFGAVYISTLLENRAGKFLKPALIAIVVVLFIPVYNLAFPNKSPGYILSHPDKYRKFGMLTWEDGKEHDLPQDFADMQGWKELAAKTDSVYKTMPDPKLTLVLCDNYGQAGAINFYNKTGIRAVSFNADYINWFDLTRQYKHLIRVKEAGNPEVELAETSPHFQISKVEDSVTNKYARERGTTIFSFINAKVDINKRIKQELYEVSNKRN